MTKIGKYDIVRELGRGAMGVVYEGLDPIIGRKVAIKTIRFDVLVGERERAEAQERFLREARSAGNLSHPCIVTVYDVGEDAGTSYIAMEYIDGESLDARIARAARMPLDQVASLIARVGDALDYAHRNGVIHRDIKPANILIGRDDRPKIVDFGIARVASSALTHTNAVLGTPFYMAPEQIAGQPTDHRADLFSLGAVLYEMLTRTKPFPGENVTTVIYNIMSAEPRPPRDFDATLPPGFDVVCRTALAKDPAARYQSGQALSDALLAQTAGYASSVSATDAALSAAETQILSARVVNAAAAAAATPPGGITPMPKAAPAAAPAPKPKAPAGPVKKGGSAVGAVLGAVLLLAAAGGGFWYWRATQSSPAPAVQEPAAAAPLVSTPPDAPIAAGGVPAAAPATSVPTPATPGAAATRPPVGQPVPGKPGPGKATSPKLVTPAAPTPVVPAAGVDTPVVVPPPTGRVYELTAVDTKPIVKTQTEAIYPETLKQKGTSATVVLQVLVTESGLVSDVKVLRPASEAAFNDAAQAAVRRWTFTPATKKGQTVACWYNVGVPFQLK